MRDAGRVAAAIGVLEDMAARHRPSKLALKAWGDDSRYAGSKDRAFVSGLVLDALRHRQSLAWRMGAQSARALVLGVLRFTWDWPVDRIAQAAAEPPHAIGALTAEETARLSGQAAPLETAPAWVQGDYPEWLDPYLARVFGDDRAAEGKALASRAPIDLRANRLKTTPEAALEALSPLGARPAGIISTALRIDAPGPTDKAPPVEAIPEFHKGWFEVQDLGSQIAAAAAGSIDEHWVLDYCAGGGGKTLAMAATMQFGRIHAYDSDARRLADTARRAERAGLDDLLVVHTPLRADALQGLAGEMEVVFVDAPCTGSGTWRRHPDAKWRLTPAQLERRMAEQDKVLAAAAPYVKLDGRLVYVTCSLLMEENEDRIAAFLAAHPGFEQVPTLDQIEASEQLEPWGVSTLFKHQTPDLALRLTPRNLGCDGFYVAVLVRRA
jgi:16S rRNA (cytosine967-C5)-methyltransferase